MTECAPEPPRDLIADYFLVVKPVVGVQTDKENAFWKFYLKLIIFLIQRSCMYQLYQAAFGVENTNSSCSGNRRVDGKQTIVP